MARTGRIKKDGDGHYHVMSRTNAKAFLFRSGRLKTELVDLLQRSAAFSGVQLDAFSVLDNHFHAGITVVVPDEPIGEAEILKRIAILKGEKVADALAAHWAALRKRGLSSEVEVALNRWRRRMHDVSEFVKTFKELVNIRYKKVNEHCGSIWSGRFASTLVESGEYWSIVRRYIELNAVRAGIVSQSTDYAWCSHATTTTESASRYVVIAGRVFEAGSVPEKKSEAGSVPEKKSEAGSVPEKKSGTVAAGTDPEWEARVLKRVVQIGAGKIFGSRAFVEMMVDSNARALPRGVRARVVMKGAFATHGWRLNCTADQAA